MLTEQSVTRHQPLGPPQVDPDDGGGGHRNGYTGFVVRLDGARTPAAATLRYGGGVNSVALRSDASFGSGHWYANHARG